MAQFRFKDIMVEKQCPACGYYTIWPSVERTKLDGRPVKRYTLRCIHCGHTSIIDIPA